MQFMQWMTNVRMHAEGILNPWGEDNEQKFRHEREEIIQALGFFMKQIVNFL